MKRDEGARTVCYLGNFSVPYSTESHVAASLEALGHRVVRVQEGETPAREVATIAWEQSAEMFLWTQTYGLAVTGGTIEERERMLNELSGYSIPSVAYHLDLWHGLDRADQLANEPYFRCDYFISTDGGHDDQWKELGVNHIWMPPAVYHAEAVDAPSRARYVSDVAFVGSWRHYGHAEHWPVRQRMLQILQGHYGRRLRCWPRNHAVRGMELNSLYASAKVVVGDSCLAGKIPGYWSDRIPETTGRGGFLVHPYIERLEECHPSLPVFEPGDWNGLIELVDHFLDNDAGREQLRQENAEHTRLHHTYKRRMQQVMEVVFGA